MGMRGYSNINMDSANVKATVTGTTVGVGILTGNGDLNIFNRSVNVNGIQKNGTDGYGIFQNYDTQNMSVKGGHIIAQGTGSAIIVKDIEKLKFNSGDDFDTKAVKASTDYDGTLGVVSDVATNYGNYKYVKIITTVISVDTSWGDMDYIFTEGQRNTSTNQYDMGTWSRVNTDGDKIVITNNRNVPIDASIVYGQDSGYISTEITGKIVEMQGASTAVTMPKNILVANSFEAYLKLSGRLATDVAAKTVIGSVTVTISE